MSASTSAETEGYGARVPWGDVLLSAIAAVSWALIGMAATAALGLHLLDADAAGSLGPMTAAVVALGAGGAVTPAGDASVFGLTGAQAHTAVEITPLGVGLVGAVLLSFFFLRSLRGAGAVVAPAELLARAGAVIALFVAMTGGLAWAGHDVVTIDGDSLGLDDLPGRGGGGLEIPGLGDVGDIGGLLPDRIGDLVDAQAAVGFTVDTAATLWGGLVWSAGVLLIALLASRRTPLPRGCAAVHRVLRPAVSALVTVVLTAVAAGFAAAAYAAIGDDHPRRIAGAALLGAPNGVWLGVPVGLFVPWDGRATGELVGVLPAPLDELLGSGAGEPVTLGRLAELDGRVWLLGVAAVLMMLLAGVLTAVRTPTAPDDARSLGFVGRCALRLGAVTALTLPLLAWLTEVSVNASLSVLGIDAFGAGLELHGDLGAALLLGTLWGTGAGAVGALLARATGAAGTRATPLARSAGTRGRGVGEGGIGDGVGVGGGGQGGGVPGSGAAGGGGWAAGSGTAGGRGGPGGAAAVGGRTGAPGPAGEAGRDSTPGLTGPGGPDTGAGAGAGGQGSTARPAGESGNGGTWRPAGAGGYDETQGSGAGGGYGGSVGGAAQRGSSSGPYSPGTPHRPPNPGTNPYLRLPDGAGEPEDARPSGPGAPPPSDAGWGPASGDPGPGAWPPAGGGQGYGDAEQPHGGTAARDDDEGRGPDAEQPPGGDDLYNAPTVAGPTAPPPGGPRRPPRPGKRPESPPSRWGETPPPPPPPPPRPGGGR